MPDPVAISLASSADPRSSEVRERRVADSDRAAKQFEELLLNELLKAMRQTVPSEDDDAGFARDTFESMFDQSIATATAGSLGLGPLLARQFGGDAASLSTMRQPAHAPFVARAAGSGGQGFTRDVGPHTRIAAAVYGAELPRPGVMPVEGARSSEYGWRDHPITHERTFHAGLDVAAPTGREILAVQRGTVVFAGRHRGYGNMVELEHPDGVVTRYAHASRLHVSVGDDVDVGEAIADVGSTGQSTGPHLHFEVRVGGRPMNPDRYLERLRHDASARGDEVAGIATNAKQTWHGS